MGHVKEVEKCLCSMKVKTKKNLIGAKDPILDENIGDSILNAFKLRPDFIGQMHAETEEKITFQQMRENSVKCALWLKKVGVKKGDVITICTRDPSIVYVPFLASIYVGAIVNPWEEEYFRDIIRVMYFLVVNKPDVIFVDDDNLVKLLSATLMLRNIDKIIKIVTIREIKSLKLNSLEAILNDDFDQAEIDNFSCEKNRTTDVAIRTFSSIAENYLGQVDVPYIAFTSPSNKQTPVMHPDDVGLWYKSLCWTHGPLLTVHAILSNVTALKSTIFNEDYLYKTIEKYKVTWVFLESEMCNQMLENEQNSDYFSDYDVSSLEVLLFDNWSIRYVNHEELGLFLPGVPIIRVYSKPEIGVITYQRDSDISIKSGGYVTKNVQLAFVSNEEDSELSWIYCKTPYITRCDKHGTKQPWYYTGDRGFYNEDGNIFVFTDCFRRKDSILLLETIEGMLRLHPNVSEAIVTTMPAYFDLDQPLAYVKAKPGMEVTRRQLIDFVENNIQEEEYKKIINGTVIIIIAYEIPRLPNGKINREHFDRIRNRFFMKYR